MVGMGEVHPGLTGHFIVVGASMPAMRRCACSRAGTRICAGLGHTSLRLIESCSQTGLPLPELGRPATRCPGSRQVSVRIELASGFTRSIRTSGLGLCYLSAELFRILASEFTGCHTGFEEGSRRGQRSLHRFGSLHPKISARSHEFVNH